MWPFQFAYLLSLFQLPFTMCMGPSTLHEFAFREGMDVFSMCSLVELAWPSGGTMNPMEDLVLISVSTHLLLDSQCIVAHMGASCRMHKHIHHAHGARPAMGRVGSAAG